jgi:hypothetical protein
MATLLSDAYGNNYRTLLEELDIEDAAMRRVNAVLSATVFVTLILQIVTTWFGDGIITKVTSTLGLLSYASAACSFF